MTHHADRFATAVKQARLREGLSQRELASLSGLPQSYISRIEKGSVNLTIASLVALANSLDLEVVFVPRALVPTVNALNRGSPGSPKASRAVRREVARIVEFVDRLHAESEPSRDLDAILRHVRDLRKLQKFLQEPELEFLRRLRRRIQAFSRRASGEGGRKLDGEGKATALRREVEGLEEFRRSLARKLAASETPDDSGRATLGAEFGAGMGQEFDESPDASPNPESAW